MKLTSHSGFTLIEIIVTLIIISIVGSMLYTYFGSAFEKSVEMRGKLQGAFNIHSVMENIMSDYYNIYGKESFQSWKTGDYIQGDRVVSESEKYGAVFICEKGGKSGSAEPVWNTKNGETTLDGEIIWRLEKIELDELKNRISQKKHGQLGDSSVDFIIKALSYIRFVKDVQTGYLKEVSVNGGLGEPKHILKITIADPSGASLTTLLTSSY